MGFCITKALGINDILVLGDSMLVIKSMVNHVDMGSNTLRSILSRIICLVTGLGKHPSSTSKGSSISQQIIRIKWSYI
jgi:hypothetical protein